MSEFWGIALSNLQAALVGFSIFGMAYVSNISFSLYYNIKIAGETFQKQKIVNSMYKILAFGFGTLLLVLATSLIIPWASVNNLPIPAEYSTVISTVATLGVCLSGALKYIMEAFNKMKNILTIKDEANTVEELANQKNEDKAVVMKGED